MIPGLQSRAAATALIVAMAIAPGAAQVPRSPCTGPDGRELQLLPRDEAATRPDFLAFRGRLLDAVVRRDVAAVLHAVDPAARVGFDGSGGVDAFRVRHIENPDVNFWQEFARVLGLGGTFRTFNDFDTPYVFSRWPEGADAFECLAVTGTGVRLRRSPGTGSRILATLSYSIVVRADSDGASPGWVRVRRADGSVGYVSAAYLRSPVDYRASFSFRNGEWKLVFYVAGD